LTASQAEPPFLFHLPSHAKSVTIFPLPSVLSLSKHSGVLGYFNRRFVKPGIFPEEMGLVINKAFDLRQRGDYREYEEMSYELVRPFVDQSRIFVQRVKDYLEKGAFSQKS
jgi:uncharacterized protein (UPF0332 family)